MIIALTTLANSWATLKGDKANLSSETMLALKPASASPSPSPAPCLRDRGSAQPCRTPSLTMASFISSLTRKRVMAASMRLSALTVSAFSRPLNSSACSSSMTCLWLSVRVMVRCVFKCRSIIEVSFTTPPADGVPGVRGVPGLQQTHVCDNLTFMYTCDGVRGVWGVPGFGKTHALMNIDVHM